MSRDLPGGNHDHPERAPATSDSPEASSIEAKMAALERRALGGGDSYTDPGVPSRNVDVVEGLPAPGRANHDAGRERIHTKLDALEQRGPDGPAAFRPPGSETAQAGRESPLEAKLAKLAPETSEPELARNPTPRPAGREAVLNARPLDSHAGQRAEVGEGPRERAWWKPARDERRDNSPDGPEPLDKRLSAIYEASVETRAGRAFFEPGDDIVLSAVRVEPERGFYTADLHGSPSSFHVGEERLDAQDLSALIRADERWNGQPVKLLSCETGQGETPIAQEVADELRVDVLAPTELAWVNRRTGEVTSGSGHVDDEGILWPNLPYDGSWQLFRPDEET
ncbi:hypothetical protein [Frankia sp. AgB32]|uniref:hypothetical protein n=1 Tax=Frankia sp. AgB32 TaxID=631119 RepID=UPI00200EC11B|nr:hypothetical protein [Frankia sp. AgB32]MCK9897129.1 hypothetical protein [Frankia sp. AgB32]